MSPRQLQLFVLSITYCLVLARPASAAAASKTQAGCACLANWKHAYNTTSAATLNGCANPDKDPKGPWCPVNPKTCASPYGNYTWQGKLIHFDYCGKVRDLSDNGCFCRAVSQGYGSPGPRGKAYQDKCYMDADNARCFVDLKSCKKPLVEDFKEWSYDYCTTSQDTSGVPDGTSTSQGGCKCSTNWKFQADARTPQGTLGPFMGCANEDRDPKGAWCVVNKVDCPSAYGYYNEFGKRIYYAYCGEVNEITQAGCMCKPSWGGGKIQDKCANPDNKPGLWCEIMPGTCKKGKAPYAAAWDFCGSIPKELVAKPKNASSSVGTPGPQVVVVLDGVNGTRSIGGGSTSSAATAGSGKSGGGGGSINKVYVLVPLLTGLAAIVTIAYTLYKCHKKRQFFKSASALTNQSSFESKGSKGSTATAGGNTVILYDGPKQFVLNKGGDGLRPEANPAYNNTV